MRVAFLGLGKMGAAIARRLHAAGHEVVIWNRTASVAQTLEAEGMRAAKTAAEAVSGCEVAVTMLIDDASTKSVVLGDSGKASGSGILEALGKGACHLTLSTLSVSLSKRLEREHQSRGQFFVAAPVFGRPNVAAEGKLWIVTAGVTEAIERVRPLLKAISRGLTVIGDQPWRAHALKLGGNFMITAMVQTLSESFIYADSQGIEPAVFLEAVNSALFQSPFYAAYGKVMLEPPERAGATIALGRKDTRLLREAAALAGTELGLADYFAGIFDRAMQAGMQDTDWAVGQYRMAQQDCRIKASQAMNQGEPQ